MTLTDSRPVDLIRIHLQFVRPFPSETSVTDVAPVSGTMVTGSSG